MRAPASSVSRPAVSARGGTAAIVTSALSKRYGDRLAVDDLDIEIPAGVISGFVGPNGAGKTTTIQMLLGLVRPTTGTGEVLGYPIAHPAAYLSMVGALIETPSFYPTMSGRRNLEVLARLGRHDPSWVDGVLERVGLADRGADSVRSYSLGMKQRLGVAAALLPNPRLLVLDEPTNGLDPAGIREMRSLLRSLADGGMTVFVSSHLLGEIEAICEHLVVISAGRRVFQGDVDGLLAEQRSDVVARPEQPSDLDRLLALCIELGYPARLQAGAVHVQAPGSFAPELNRRAAAAGITLAALGATQASLEDAFFGMTDSMGMA